MDERLLTALSCRGLAAIDCYPHSAFIGSAVLEKVIPTFPINHLLPIDETLAFFVPLPAYSWRFHSPKIWPYDFTASNAGPLPGLIAVGGHQGLWHHPVFTPPSDLDYEYDVKAPRQPLVIDNE
jgi:hypothetical protein